MKNGWECQKNESEQIYEAHCWFCIFLFESTYKKNCQNEKRRIRRRAICEYRKRTSSMRKLQRYIFNCTFRTENIPHSVITIQAFLLISILRNRSFMGTIIEMYRHIVFHGFGTRFKVVVCSKPAKRAPTNVHTWILWHFRSNKRCDGFKY